MISLTGMELEVGAELEMYGEEVEGACEGQSTENTIECTDTNTQFGNDVRNDNDLSTCSIAEDIKSIIDHAVVKLIEAGCIYSKDLVSMITAPSTRRLKSFYNNLEKTTKLKGYRYFCTNRRLGTVIYNPIRFSEDAI